MKTKSLALLSLLLSVAITSVACAQNDSRAPEVPDSLQVPAGHKVSFYAYAIGVQIYTATPSAADPTKLVWTLAGPEAGLFDADGATVGIHLAYAGSTRPGWRSESGSLVVGARYVPPVTVDPSSIPWLLLSAVHTEGHGIFKRTTFIQRVNTSGGLAPATPPTIIGEEARIPYTAEYVFFREQK